MGRNEEQWKKNSSNFLVLWNFLHVGLLLQTLQGDSMELNLLFDSESDQFCLELLCTCT